MNRLYKEFFDSYLTGTFANPQNRFRDANDCYVKALSALYWAAKSNAHNTLNALEQTSVACPDAETPILEAKLILLAAKKPLGDKNLISSIESIIEKFPYAGFARVLKIEVLQQARQSKLVKQTALELLDDFPDAKWLNIFLVQANIYLKDYPSAAKHAKELPRSITRTLNLFWSKVWHPYIFLMPIFIFLSIFAILEYLPFSTFYLLAIMLPLMGSYLFRTKKDRITLTWFTGLSLILFISTFFLRDITN